MKIAYVTIHIESKIINGGVGNKIWSQISAWKSLGHVVELFSLTPDPILSIPDVRQFQFGTLTKIPILKFIAREISRSRMLGRMIAEVRNYQPDIIYLRFGLFAFPLQSLFKIAPVVMEVNSNDLDEYRNKGGFFYWINRLTRDYLFSRCSGFAMVSHEIADLPVNRKYSKPQCVIANGVDLETIPPIPSPVNTQPVLVFIGTPGSPWHGVDKLYELAEHCPDIRIEIIGYEAEQTRVMPSNITFHGYLARNQYMEVFAHADVALGSLALHRNNMYEASPLKVREALAYGVPLIIPFTDTDLKDLKTDFLMHLPNTEDNVKLHAVRIREFAYRMMGKRVDRDLIRPIINQRQKEEKRLRFFADVIDASRSK